MKNKVAGKKATKSDRMLFQLVNHAMVDCLTNPQQNVMVSLFTPLRDAPPSGPAPLLLRGLLQLPLRLHGRAALPPPGRRTRASPTACAPTTRSSSGLPSGGLMPKPRFILSTSLACDANTLTFRHMAEFYGFLTSPWMYPSSPPPGGGLCGRPAAADGPVPGPADRHPCGRGGTGPRRGPEPADHGPLPAGGLESARGKQVLSDLTSELFRTAAFHFLLGLPEVERYARQLLREIETAPPAQGQATPLDPHHPLLGGSPAAALRPEHPGADCRLRHELRGHRNGRPHQALRGHGPPAGLLPLQRPRPAAD